MPTLSPPTVSVAMCTYNGAVHVSTQLDSIAGQDRLPDELVVCDDRSTDATVEILRRFTERAPFPVRIVVNETNLGSSRNFEQAIRLARGEVILLCDQDDCWRPNKVSRFVQQFVSDPNVEGLFSNARLTDEALQPTNGDLWTFVGIRHHNRQLAMEGCLLAMMLSGNVVFGTVFAIRSAVKSLVLPFPHPLPKQVLHDGWIAAVLACRGTLRGFDVILSDYRQHAGQQVGVADRAAPSSASRLLGSQPERRKVFRELLATWEMLYAAIGTRGDPSRLNLQPLAERIMHFEARANLPASRLHRVPVIVAELVSGRYRRNSGRLFTPALRDLVA